MWCRALQDICARTYQWDAAKILIRLNWRARNKVRLTWSSSCALASAICCFTFIMTASRFGDETSDDDGELELPHICGVRTKVASKKFSRKFCDLKKKFKCKNHIQMPCTNGPNTGQNDAEIVIIHYFLYSHTFCAIANNKCWNRERDHITIASSSFIVFIKSWFCFSLFTGIKHCRVRCNTLVNKWCNCGSSQWTSCK
jgi:hypothetical protein